MFVGFRATPVGVSNDGIVKHVTGAKYLSGFLFEFYAVELSWIFIFFFINYFSCIWWPLVSDRWARKFERHDHPPTIRIDFFV